MDIDTFKRAKIYTIRSHKTNLVYVGSTIEPYLSSRMRGHRKGYKRFKRGVVTYCSSFDIFEIDKDCYIELHEMYPCESKLELRKREGEIIRSLDCVNRAIAGRTRKEYREDNKERIREKDRQYRQNNKEKDKARKQKWKEDNPEYFKKYHKQYHQNNKQKIKARQSKSYQCECGNTITWGSKSRHFRTKKHQAFINNQ
jgi:alpha-galactosidase/6-phospho-beta-glucosidase family protein